MGNPLNPNKHIFLSLVIKEVGRKQSTTMDDAHRDPNAPSHTYSFVEGEENVFGRRDLIPLKKS